MTLNRKTLTGSALGLLAVLFVALVLLSNLLFRGARLDLTEQSLHTLSEGTRNILGKLDEPIHISLYFSDKSTAESNRPDVRGLRLYYDRVRELLEEMNSRSGGKLELEIIDPQPYSEAEDRAAAAGLQGVPLGPSGEKIFIGLVATNSTDGQEVIPLLEPNKESLLEYDIAKRVYDLSTVKKPSVGFLSGLPMTGTFDPQRQGMSDPWVAYDQLSQLFDLKPLDGAELKAVDPAIKVLVVIHPKQLSEDAQYAIDQFVLRGGHLLVFVDPDAQLEQVQSDPNNPMAAMMANKSSNLPALFKAWGVDYSPDQVVLDRAHALSVSVAQGAPPVRHPAILRLGKADLDKGEIITANLDTLHFATAGHFKLAKDSPYKLTPLLQSSAQSMTQSAQQLKFQRDPASLLAELKPTGELYILAGRLEGKFKTAFPNRNEAGHLAEAKDSGVIFLVGDTDVLSDRLWVRVQNFLGQKLVNAFADNGDFFINLVDNLSGSSDLISIRGRGTAHRPFTKVEELKATADDRFRAKEQELQRELNDTERKLTELQSGKSKDEKFVLSPAQQQELGNFLKRKVEIRKELREVRRQLDADIDALGAKLKFINIALMPLLVTLGTLGFLGWQAKHRKR